MCGEGFLGGGVGSEGGWDWGGHCCEGINEGGCRFASQILFVDVDGGGKD